MPRICRKQFKTFWSLRLNPLLLPKKFGHHTSALIGFKIRVQSDQDQRLSQQGWRLSLPIAPACGHDSG